MLSDEQAKTVKPTLEALLGQCDYAARRRHDPVEFTWDYSDPLDHELVALVSSCLAYGRVELVKQAIGEVLDHLGPRPTRTLADMHRDELRTRLDGFVYRMTRADDVVDLLVAADALRQDFGSIEDAYRSAPGDSHLTRSSFLVTNLRGRRARPDLARGFRYLLPDPADGSACKRLHLFFRWMGRGPDGVDLGVWKSLDPAALIMPLDTHTARLCRYIGLSDRKSTDLKAALEVTRSLAKMDPEDPLKYDFALCHLGISGDCIHRRSPDHCPSCPIEPICTL